MMATDLCDGLITLRNKAFAAVDDVVNAGLLAPSTHRHLRPTCLRLHCRPSLREMVFLCWFCRPTDTGSLMAGGRYTNDRTSKRLHARACRRDLRAAGVRREPASNLPRRNNARPDEGLLLAG